ncbi:uncharacterized protein C1orf105 homolog isoform X2 [Arvicola amphibius]|uniref:uncharacterized protein C1orf105 homolog isoform X2 n=1 Tax=Arvicola amphibius TaxID=1047088 RepID=UPI0018E3C108|nr:uncharacterized protein C1orf105 homolog isoform X2 [Arvicola amphibius]
MLNLCHCRASARGLSMRQTFLQAFVPKFDKVPWLSEASLVNKPLVLSIPGRYPSSATVLTLSKKDMDLPNLLQVPDVILKARKYEHGNLSPRNKQLYHSTCREMKMVQPKNFIIPDHEKPSFQNSVNPRVMLLRHPDVQQFNHPCNDIPTESIRYRLPIMGPRTAIFHSLLSGAYKTPQETQDLSFPRKKLMNKTVKQ